MVLVGFAPGISMSVDAGTGFALLCALCWGLSTVASRGVMVEMSLPLAAGLRVTVGLIAMLVFVAVTGELNSAALWPAAAAADATDVVPWLVLLATLSGGVPLLVYFKGLELTRASTAGYFEMIQTLTAVVITWAFFGARLMWHQVVAGAVLIGALAMVQRTQGRTALAYAAPAAASAR
jgi:drug/metabolite transporter (DMT)-like permease